MNPHTLMRRIQRTCIGLSCIFGGCAALLALLSNFEQFAWLNHTWQNTAAAADDAPASGSGSPVLPDVAPKLPQPGVVKEIDKKALINDLKPQVPAEAEFAPATTTVIIPPGRPEWVEADFAHENSDTNRVAVSSGPYPKRHEALRALDEELVASTQAFVSDYLGSRAAGTLVPVDIETIRRECVRPANIYHEQIQVSLGPMFQSHALLEFSPSFKHQLDERWKSIVVAGRVTKLGVIAFGVLMALSVVFGYFKADNATRGYYTTRLQLGTAGAILALVAGGFWLFTRVS